MKKDKPLEDGFSYVIWLEYKYRDKVINYYANKIRGTQPDNMWEIIDQIVAQEIWGIK